MTVATVASATAVIGWVSYPAHRVIRYVEARVLGSPSRIGMFVPRHGVRRVTARRSGSPSEPLVRFPRKAGGGAWQPVTDRLC